MGKYMTSVATYTFTLRIVTCGIVFLKFPGLIGYLRKENNWRVNRTFLGMEVRIILESFYCIHL